MNNKTIGIFAHVDAGKTTFSEQILYNTGAIRTRGRVDDKNTLLDADAIERQRGITIFSEQAVFTYGDSRYFLADTPGHVDFSAEAERTMQILDYAILLVSAVEGIQGHTETLWNLLARYAVPTLIFINKTDRTGADAQAVIAEMQRRLDSGCIDFSAGVGEAETREAVAMLDETLLEAYLDGGRSDSWWQAEMQRLVKSRQLFPCVAGAALHNRGVDLFLDVMEALTLSAYDPDAPFGGRVYKIRHDKRGSRLTFLKVTQGQLRVKDTIAVSQEDGLDRVQKINEIRRYSGLRYDTLQSVRAGELCAVTGLSGLQPGDGVGCIRGRRTFWITPTLSAQVLYDPSEEKTAVLAAFQTLAEEEPMLETVWDERLDELRIRVMGPIQLEVLEAVVQERFGMSVRFGPCRVLYQETLAAPVIGCGHFEPLKHYAEVHLRLEPGVRGSGITFESACPTDLLDKNWQNLIRTHVFEKEHRGVLTGAPLTDVKITLLSGAAHMKHTEGGDFRQATYRAIRQGLLSGESLLLEPVYRYVITVPEENLGRVLSDIERMSGSFAMPAAEQRTAVVRGEVPVSEAMHYPQELLAFTKGRGTVQMGFGGYRPCHNADTVIAAANYHAEADMDNPADSVFCSHGSGYVVKWYDAPQKMHKRPL